MTGKTSQKMEFVGFDRELVDALLESKGFILEALPEVLDGFYAQVRGEPDVMRFFQTSQHIEHAKSMQIRHWDIITNATFDDEYVESVTRIGEVHNRLGIEPRWYIGGYNFILSGLTRKLLEPQSRLRISPKWLKQRATVIDAITKAALLDMDYAISVYIEAGQRDRRNTLAELADVFEQSVGSVSVKLDTVAGRLKNTAGELMTAFTETDANATSADQNASQVASNVNTVAAASEELASSVSEIGRQVSQSYEISEEAASNSSVAIETMNSLTIAASRVGEIIGLINDIAAKTNLLALNATIEAARAGSAGKGFAVVASEVKTLAEQTALATAEISSQVEEIQSVTASSASAIENVHGTIERLNEIAAVIAAAVEQQESATQEISSNIQLAAGGAGDASTAISGISTSAKRTLEDARRVDSGTEDLSTQARHLKEVSAEFLVKIAGM
ncbi:globin-coupled sensor protein [Roseibium sp. SCPC15]|uniref:globin-coupled sensor protein n=1 Tax=Roseibium sp. SCP15 TaxID=3141376 RepID=UPI00333B3266